MTDLDPDRLRTLMRTTVRDVQLPADMTERVTARVRPRRRGYVPLLSTAGLLVVVALVASALLLRQPSGSATLAGPATGSTSPTVAPPSPAPVTLSGFPQLHVYLPYNVLATTGTSQIVAFFGDTDNGFSDTWLCTGILPVGQSLSQVQQPDCGGWNGVAAQAQSVSGPDPLSLPSGSPAGTSLAVGVVRADITSAQVLLATPQAIDAAATPAGGSTTDVQPVDVRLFPAMHTVTGDLRVYSFQYPSKYNFAGITGRNAAGQLVLNDRTRTYCGPDPKTHQNVPCPAK